jgi:hypothetical protein
MLQNRGFGAGNVSRAYMNALWPLVFGYFFWRFGASTISRAALRIIYVAALIRMAFGLFNYYVGRTFIIPVINYSIDPQDLRMSGSIVLVIALLFAAMEGRALSRAFNAAIALFAVWVILLGGSRTGAAMLVVIPLFAFTVSRRWLAACATLSCAAVLIFTLNAYPRSLESLPIRATRALSVFLMKERLDVQEEARESNLWHRVALPEQAYRRWSSGLRTMAVGTGVKPFQPVNSMVYLGRDTIFRWAEVSADMGAYESAFWTLLAVLGAVGLCLYALFLIWLLRQLLPALMKRKRRDATWALLFWACLWIVQWFIFAIPTGSYPSWEIFLGILALGALRDEEKKAPAPRPRIEPVEDPRMRHMRQGRRDLARRQFAVRNLR